MLSGDAPLSWECQTVTCHLTLMALKLRNSHFKSACTSLVKSCCGALEFCQDFAGWVCPRVETIFCLSVTIEFANWTLLHQVALACP